VDVRRWENLGEMKEEKGREKEKEIENEVLY